MSCDPHDSRSCDHVRTAPADRRADATQGDTVFSLAAQWLTLQRSRNAGSQITDSSADTQITHLHVYR